MQHSLMETYKRLPVAFESGSGAWLVDDKGVRYLDALSGISVCNLGHAHPVITDAIAKQAGRLVHTSNLYEIPLQEQLATRLCTLTGLDKVFFCNSGAEANETAIKLCRKFAHEKGITEPVIIATHGSFHGRTMASLTASGNDKIKQGFEPLMPGFLHVPYNDVEVISELAEGQLNVIAIMIEPIQGEGGIKIPDPGYLQKVRDICTQQGWLLVLDEIQSGMCRSGKWFAYQHEQVQPDILTLAKALGNGVPIGACLANALVAAPMTTGSHGSTFGGNPLASCVGLAVIQYMNDNKLDQRSMDIGDSMLREFNTRLANHKGINDIRGKGLMLAIELDRDCSELVNMALAKHLLINVTAGNIVRLLPPLIINEMEMEQIIDTVCEIIIKFVGE